MSGPITPHRDPRNDWRPDSNPVYRQTNQNIEQMAKPVVEPVVKATANGDWKDKIDRLDSKGDMARSRVFLDGELDVNPLVILTRGRSAGVSGKIGGLDASGSADVVLKGQSAHLIDVTRDSNAADSTYTVRYTKMSQGGVGAEFTGTLPIPLNTPKPGGQFDGKLTPQLFARGDVYGGTANTVEMRFANKEDAQRAAEALEKLAAADTVDDGIQTGIASQKFNPTSPLFGPALAASQTYEGSSNNLANPMSEYGEVNPGVRRAAGVSDQDLAFLGDHVVAQEVSVLGGGRAAVEGRLMAGGELKLPGGQTTKVPGMDKIPGLEAKAGNAIVPGIYRNNAFTRRVEYPTDVSAGRIVDSFNSYDQVTVKWRDVQSLGLNNVGSKNGLSGTVQHRADDNYEVALANTSVSWEQSIPAGTTVDLGYLASRPPDFSGPAKVDSWVMGAAPSEWPGLAGRFVPPLGGLATSEQRVDMVRHHVQYEVSSADGQRMANGMGVSAGGFSGEINQFRRTGDFIENRLELVKRDGHNTTETLRAGINGVAAVEGSLTKYGGVDDYDTADKTVPPTPDPDPPQPPEPPKPVDPEPGPTEPKPVSTHWQVQPFEGVNVRSSPTTDADNKVAIVQSGSFLDGNGETKKDKDGYTWIKVTGRDQEDKMVEGWVRGDNLKSYDKRYGDNDATGRVNPAREKTGQDKIIVKQDDNLWNLARQYNQDFNRLLAANPHLLDPNVIFKGDSVYLPGR